MRLKLNIIFIICSFLLNAQGGWKKRYYLPNSSTSELGNIFETPSGNLVMVGLTYETLNNDQSYKLTLAGTDPQGTILWEKKYGSSKFTYLNFFGQRGFINDANFYYLTTCVRDSNNRYIGLLIKFNFNGDTLWQKIYRDSDTLENVIPVAITKSLDGGFLLTGWFQNGSAGGQQCLVIKTDVNGNELWRKKINKSVPDVQAGFALVQDSASKKIIIVGYQYIGSASNAGTYSNILILDSLGNKLIQTTFNNYDGGPFSEIIQLKDKNFMTGGGINANNDLGGSRRLNTVVVKFDINANIIWKKTYDTLSLYNQASALSERSNGDIIMAGILDTLQNYNQQPVVKVKVFRIDKDGKVKWRRNIGSAHDLSTCQGIASMRPTRDGGYILAAGFPYLPDPKPYSIIKIDSTACDTLESVCQIMETLGIENFYKKTGWGFEVFPNPAKDLVNFKIDAPQDKKFVVKMNEISGRQVDEINVDSQTDVGLNILDYKPGIYFVSIYYQGKSVETKKLVIAR